MNWYMYPFLLFFPILAWILWLCLGRRMVRTSTTALLAIAIPAALLAVVTVVFAVLRLPYSPVTESCLIASICLVPAAFLLSVIFAIGREWEMAKSMGFGSGICFIASVIAFWSAFAFYCDFTIISTPSLNWSLEDGYLIRRHKPIATPTPCLRNTLIQPE